MTWLSARQRQFRFCSYWIKGLTTVPVDSKGVVGISYSQSALGAHVVTNSKGRVVRRRFFAYMCLQVRLSSP